MNNKTLPVIHLSFRKSMLFICRMKREGEEKSVSTRKLFQMLTTRSVKNIERAVQLECCLYEQQRLLHDQLSGSSGEGHQRQLCHRRGPDDDRPRVHGHAEDRRWSLEQGLAWWTHGWHQHHPVVHWCCQGCRKSHPGAQWKTYRNGFPCSCSGRFRGRSDCPTGESSKLCRHFFIIIIIVVATSVVVVIVVITII